MTTTTPKTRKTDSENTQKYKAKRQTHRIEFNLYADNEVERKLIEKCKDLTANRELKTVIVQALNDYFAKN